MPSSVSRSPSRPRSRSGSGRRRERRKSSGSRERSGSRRRSRSGDRSRRRDRSRSRRGRSRSGNRDSTYQPHPSPTVPASIARQDVEESSDSSGDEGKVERTEKGLSREKKIKKVDITNPLSTFERQTRQRKQHFVPSPFIKEKWMGLRGMDENGKFITEDDSKTDVWKHVAKSDRLVKKYAGDVFSETRLDDGLHSIVDKNETPEEKDLVRQQKTVGAVAHLTLQGMEGYAKLYNKLYDFVLAGIGPPKTTNPDWTGEEDTEHPQYIYSTYQNQTYTQFQDIQREFQVDVAEPMANVARIAASAFTDSLDKRREKVISRIKRNNTKAAVAITRIPPSSYYMFGGDHSQLAKVVELTKDLSTTADKPGYSHTPTKNKPKGGGGGGGGGNQSRGGYQSGHHGGHGGGSRGAGSSNRGGHEQKPQGGGGKDSFRGGNSSRGRK